MKADTTATHRQRIVRVLAYIESHLDDALSVSVLARRAGFAAYHFQRVFRQVVGESPHRYVQRLRLERAAFRLKRTAQPVTELALDSGYRAHEAFTRAFRSEFGVSPLGYRAGQPWSTGHADSEPTLVTLAPQRMAFVRHVGPYSHAARAFTALRAWAAPRGLLERYPLVGSPLDHKSITAPAQLRYDLGLIIDDSVTDTSEVAERVLRGGKYVRVRHHGPYSGLDALYDFIHATWLPSKGLRSANAPPFEIYLRDPRNLGNASSEPEQPSTDVYVPLCCGLSARSDD